MVSPFAPGQSGELVRRTTFAESAHFQSGLLRRYSKAIQIVLNTDLWQIAIQALVFRMNVRLREV